MDTIEALKKATILAQTEGSLPDFLADRLFLLVDALLEAGTSIPEITQLAEQVAEYDSFAQTGYMGMGVDNLVLEKSLLQLEAIVENLKED